MPPCWRLIAEGSGGSVLERGDVQAVVVPKAPDRSVFNSVFYEDGERAAGVPRRGRGGLRAAGVRAWTVWVPEDDAETAAGLERAGHALDGAPRYMGMPLAELREPRPATTWRSRARGLRRAGADQRDRLRLSAGDYVPSPRRRCRGSASTSPRCEGEEVCTLGIWPHGSDAVAIWVATLPEARGRGIAGRLLAHGLRNAREDGHETTTLQSSKLGRPVYERLGYRDYGASQMWERRRT